MIVKRHFKVFREKNAITLLFLRGLEAERFWSESLGNFEDYGEAVSEAKELGNYYLKMCSIRENDPSLVRLKKGRKEWLKRFDKRKGKSKKPAKLRRKKNKKKL